MDPCKGQGQGYCRALQHKSQHLLSHPSSSNAESLKSPVNDMWNDTDSDCIVSRGTVVWSRVEAITEAYGGVFKE